ncbi:sensor histidine kinase [Aurantiacibacter sediminis]|uniref:histidine kinase n=1 Tax=Aurantiacibacter sediminis TaxID=2793064 RepID=A0ABS0N029_9SPHN|nr:HAMP domain-containing histidine kinase [Aurantiacibacter sediminis]MBH5321321.1 HAMP domain-containing histidine kinase [Aurantiacibacter sediminis]
MTGLLTILCAGIVAYFVEDRIIDHLVQSTARDLISDTIEPGDLPSGFSIYSTEAAPPEIEIAMAEKQSGEGSEFRMADGSYFHATAISRDGNRQYLIYDASDALVVTPIALTAAWMSLGSLFTFVLIAAIVANSIGRRVAKRSERLLSDLQQCRTPDEVSALAERQDIADVSAFLTAHAEVWHKRTQAVRQQENTVSFLAHELRTPLQSARASIAVIRDDVPSSAALDRLDRAISRLTRASQATLFIGADVEQLASSRLSVFAIWGDLRTEYAPLAAQRGQYIAAPKGSDASVEAPREAVEAAIANLVGNAISHGSPGEISLVGFRDHFAIRNPVSSSPNPGFGLGMTILERLLGKLGWRLETARSEQEFEVRIFFEKAITS